MSTASTCKFCQLLVTEDLSARLPHLVADIPTALAVVNRRPAAPGHVTFILKEHFHATSRLDDAAMKGVASLAGQISAFLEVKYRPRRVVFLGDGKLSAHIHLHLIPEEASAPLDLGAVITDLNQSVRSDTITVEQALVEARELQAALSAAARR